MSSNLDQLFKKALQNKSYAPPAYIWKNIEHHLRQKEKRIGYWWRRGIAATITLLASIASIWLLQEKKNIVNPSALVQQLPALNNPIQQGIVAQAINEKQFSLASVCNFSSFSQADKNEDVSITDTSLVQLPNKQEIQTLCNISPLMNLKTKGLRRDLIPLTSKEAFRNNKEYLLLLNDKTEEKNKINKIRFALSGHVVPGYSTGSYSSSLKNTRGNSYSKDQMDGLMNVGGGIKISVSTGKRFSVQTGIFYSRMGQKTTESVTIARALSLSSLSQKTITTPLGNIKTSTKAIAYRSSGASLLNNIGNKDESIEQTFGTLELPLSVRYRLNDNKVGFFVSGGFSGNFIISNKVYLKTDKDKEYLGSTEDIRDFNISTDWELGIEYPLTNKIRIVFAPGFKYYLQSLSKNENIEFKPYLFSLSTGIGIEF